MFCVMKMFLWMVFDGEVEVVDVGESGLLEGRLMEESGDL